MTFNKIDDKFSVLENNLKIASKNLDFICDIEFTLDESFTKENIDNLGYSGVYLIEIKNSGEKDSLKN